jgi:hypothetical protein
MKILLLYTLLLSQITNIESLIHNKISLVSLILYCSSFAAFIKKETISNSEEDEYYDEYYDEDESNELNGSSILIDLNGLESNNDDRKTKSSKVPEDIIRGYIRRNRTEVLSRIKKINLTELFLNITSEKFDCVKKNDSYILALEPEIEVVINRQEEIGKQVKELRGIISAAQNLANEHLAAKTKSFNEFDPKKKYIKKENKAIFINSATKSEEKNTNKLSTDSFSSNSPNDNGTGNLTSKNETGDTFSKKNNAENDKDKKKRNLFRDRSKTLI